MKKLFTLIVAICATTLAWADSSGSCGENVTYSLVESTGTLTISGTGAMNDYYYSDVPWKAYSSSIKKVVINNSVTSIGKYAFYGCTGLTSVTIPNSVTSIKQHAFYGCTGLTSITIPNSVTSIGDEAFRDCSGLTSITIPNSVTSIGNNAFNGCTGLTSVTIPNSVTSIGNNAFYNCSKLTSITIPNSVTSIGQWAFSGCTGLTSITIPNSVTEIGLAAFLECTGLTSVTIGNGVTSIGEGVFSGCTGMTSINVAEDNLNYASIDGVLYSKDKKTLIMCPRGKTGSFTIPNGVTSTGKEAFSGCTALTSVTIPNSVTSIDYFGYGGAFYGCTGLTSMTVEATNPPLAGDKYGNGLAMPNYDIPLYVPAGRVSAYKAATEWKKFTNIQAIPATGVNEAAAEKSEVKKIIDRNGIIYIEKDGTRYFLNGGKAE